MAYPPSNERPSPRSRGVRAHVKSSLAAKSMPRSAIRRVYTYGGNLKFYPFGIRFQLGSYKSSAKWRMAILLREMRSRRRYVYSKSSSSRGRPSLLFSPLLFLSRSLFPSFSVSCLIDGTRVTLSLSLFLSRASSPILPLSFRRPGSDKESVSGDNLGSYRSSARRSKVRYIGAVKLVPQKRCPKGSASRADKAAILRSSECTRLSQRAPSPSFGLREKEREPFIEVNPFNVFFDVTVTITPYFLPHHSRNHEAR